MPTVIATSFADLSDVAAFNAAIAAGATPEEAYKVGDDGKGCYGDNTAVTNVNYCALPPEILEAKYGSVYAAKHAPVMVTCNGVIAKGVVGDVMPHIANITNGAGIDLNPGFQKALNLIPPVSTQVDWDWA